MKVTGGILFFLSTVLCSCQQFDVNAERFKKESELVLNHFSIIDPDTLKHKAALFLLGNMHYHQSLITTKDNSELTLQNHTAFIGADFLISEINHAFAIWDKCIWKDSITTEGFFEYILPYCVAKEEIQSYRMYFHDKYKYLIAGITNPQKAFDKVFITITKKYKVTTSKDSLESLNPIVVEQRMNGNCDERSILLTHIMRALCIPVTYDFTPNWANYSIRGHTWVSYISQSNETFVISDYDSISKRGGIIDASLLKFDSPLHSKPLFNIDSIKRISKIWRNTYRGNEAEEGFINPTIIDVSEQYGLTYDLQIPYSQKGKKRFFLCTFRTGEGWQPVLSTFSDNGLIRFNNIGTEICYFIGIENKNSIKPFSNPFILYSDHTIRTLGPDHSNTETITLRSKYPITPRWVLRSQDIVGTIFEASNTEKFIVKDDIDTLHIISEIPIGIQEIFINPTKSYRYFRFRSGNDHSRMSEVSIYGKDSMGNDIEMKGKLLRHKISEKNASAIVDKNYTTFALQKIQSWVGYDFGPDNQQKITRISYCARNDGNMIEPGDMYELLFYDRGWKSLGKQIASSNELIYNRVPQNALLWLKNHTKGYEERVFTYDDNHQKWW